MRFFKSIESVLVHIVAIGGRATRSEYWSWLLLRVSLTWGMLNLLDLRPEWEEIIVFINLALLLPDLSVSIRRLHDLDRSGFWIAVFLAPFAAHYYLFDTHFADLDIGFTRRFVDIFWLLPGTLLMLGGMALIGLLWLYWHLQDGSIGPNRYGPDPLGRRALPNPVDVYNARFQ